MTLDETHLAAAIVTRALRRSDLKRRGVFLRALLAHAAAGLALTEGERSAGEAVYRIADAVVERGRR